MKKLILTVLMCSAIFTLAACGSDETDSTEAGTSASAGTSSDGYTFTVDGITIAMHENAADIIEALGDPVNYTEAASCAFEGLDKTYTYSDFILRTYPNGDEDYVYGIDILSDMVETEEGLTIGDSTEDVEDLYPGAAADSTGAYVIESGDMYLDIRTTDGTVTAIYYTATLE